MHKFWFITVDAQINVVEMATHRTRLNDLANQSFSLRAHLKERSEINPVRALRLKLLKIRVSKFRKIVSGRPMNCEMGLPGSIQRHRDNSSGMTFDPADVLGGKRHPLHAAQNSLATLIFSYRADEENSMTKPFRVSRKVKRRASQMFLVPDQIPQHLTDADNLHELLVISTRKNSRTFRRPARLQSGSQAAAKTHGPVVRRPA